MNKIKHCKQSRLQVTKYKTGLLHELTKIPLTKYIENNKTKYSSYQQLYLALQTFSCSYWANNNNAQLITAPAANGVPPKSGPSIPHLLQLGHNMRCNYDWEV